MIGRTTLPGHMRCWFINYIILKNCQGNNGGRAKSGQKLKDGEKRDRMELWQNWKQAMDFIFDINSALAALAWFSQTAGSLAVYLIAGVLPCFLWLLFYLARDRHPEPKQEIAKVFFLGALVTAPAVGLQIFLINAINSLGLPEIIALLLANILAIALIEEYAKYFAVWVREQAAQQNRHLDEPVDFVIYMVVAALGFAAVENLLFLLPAVQDVFFTGNELLRAESAMFLVSLSLFRSLTAILLHTLCSGVLGYYMAMAFCRRKRKSGLLLRGFVIVSVLHGLYNFSIMKSEDDSSFLFVPLIIIFGLAIALYRCFNRLLKMKSVCKF